MGHARLKRQREFPGASHFIDRHGKRRWRYREKGFTAQLGTDYGSDEFVRRYEAALRCEKVKGGVGQDRTRPGTINALVLAFYETVEWRQMADYTKKTRRYILEALRRDHGEKRVSLFKRRHVMEIMADKSETPAAGQRMLQMLRRLMDLAVLLEIRPDNPTLGVKMPKSKNPEGFHTWSEEEIDIFNKAYPPGTTAHTAMTLMLWTGAAVGDACQMGWHNVKDGKIEYRRRKTRNSVDILIVIPIQPPLQAVLDLIPKEQKTFLLNNRGVQYPAATLGQGMARWCDAAGLTHCTSHGLRKACARRLADALASPHEIQAVTGHTNLAMVSHYTRAADRTSLASSGMAKVLAQSERGIEGG